MCGRRGRWPVASERAKTVDWRVWQSGKLKAEALVGIEY
jgi:hypothetical protein